MLRLARKPDHIAICNCGLCRPLGAAYGYFEPAELTLDGETRPFQRDDLDEVWLTVHFCPHCGALTHYTPTGRAPLNQIGVNMRLFPQDELDGIPVIYQDGRVVIGPDDAFVTTGTGHIGDGKAF
jgi:hypothetical protein